MISTKMTANLMHPMPKPEGQQYSQVWRLEAVRVAEAPLWHHEQGLQYTATGYGSKIPTRYKVHYNNRWYRVYSICYSNVSSEYILVKGQRIFVQFSDMYED